LLGSYHIIGLESAYRAAAHGWRGRCGAAPPSGLFASAEAHRLITQKHDNPNQSYSALLYASKTLLFTNHGRSHPHGYHYQDTRPPRCCCSVGWLPRQPATTVQAALQKHTLTDCLVHRSTDLLYRVTRRPSCRLRRSRPPEGLSFSQFEILRRTSDRCVC
jgi:hypothetical protein